MRLYAQMGRLQAEDSDSRLAQRLQEEFNSSSGARPKRTAASEAKKRLAEVQPHVLHLKELHVHPLRGQIDALFMKALLLRWMPQHPRCQAGHTETR